jgi:hypothetical protein
MLTSIDNIYPSTYDGEAFQGCGSTEELFDVYIIVLWTLPQVISIFSPHKVDLHILYIVTYILFSITLE